MILDDEKVRYRRVGYDFEKTIAKIYAMMISITSWATACGMAGNGESLSR